TAETKAIDLPSGDQIALPASVAIVVNCRASPPFRSMTHSWLSPERLDSKRIFFPSGLQRGCRSFLVVFVSCRGPLRSVGASQMLDEVLLPARFTSVKA